MAGPDPAGRHDPGRLYRHDPRDRNQEGRDGEGLLPARPSARLGRVPPQRPRWFVFEGHRRQRGCEPDRRHSAAARLFPSAQQREAREARLQDGEELDVRG